MIKGSRSQGALDQSRPIGGDGMNPKVFQFLGGGNVVDRPRMPFITRIHDLPGNLVRNVSCLNQARPPWKP